MKVRSLHRWDLSYRRAATLQKELAPRLVLRGGPGPPRRIAGADLSYDARTDRLFAAVLLLDGETLEPVEEATAEGRCRFPYIPGLLSFREAPLLLQAFRKLRSPAPDLVLIDGQGTAHPRGFGIACHVGLILERPTVGCAKSLLVGTHAEPGPNPGDHAPLRYRGRMIGSVLRTREAVRPVYVSPGHLVGHAAARRLVLACCRGRRLPEPTRLAHIRVGKLRRERTAASDETPSPPFP